LGKEGKKKMEDKEDKGELQNEKIHNLLFSSDVVPMI
jgi:hypothetical protein